MFRIIESQANPPNPNSLLVRSIHLVALCSKIDDKLQNVIQKCPETKKYLAKTLQANSYSFVNSGAEKHFI